MIRKFAAPLLLALGIGINAGAKAQEINFGIISTDSSSVQKDKWEPFIADMRKRTGLDIKAFYAPDYNGVIEAMRFNKIQVAWYGNKSAMEAVDRANGEVFARVVFADGSQGFYSVLIANKDSAIRSLDDVLKNPGKWTFGAGDPNSTSGTLVPTYYLWGKNNIDITKHFKAVRVGSHGTNILAVLARHVDVATNNTEEMERLKEQQPEKYAQIQVLWKSPLIPSDPFVYRKDLPADVKTRLRDFMLSYGNTPEDKAVLKNIYNYGGFVASDDTQLLPIRQIEVFKERLKVAASEMNDDDKQAKLAELDAKLAGITSQIK